MKIFTKYNLVTFVLWCAFGFTSYAAGVRFSVNPVAFIGMYVILITMVAREFGDGLRQGSDISNKVWKESLDRIFEKERNK